MNHYTRIIISLIVVLSAIPIVLGGCSVEYYGSHGHRDATYWTQGEPSDHSDAELANRRLARAVRNQLERNKKLQNDNIGVKADDGDITLLGHVHSTAELERAIGIARSMPEVNGVKSRIVVEVNDNG